MTKNTAKPYDGFQVSAGQRVAVLDEAGLRIGYTYPKRAKGLIKKGRAVPVSDFVIRLKDCPAHTCAEVFTMDTNYIFFNPREWHLYQEECEGADYGRFYASDPIRGGLTEMVTLSNFGSHYVRIGTELHLEKNTGYHFVFWLNGGENDAQTEVCNLLLIFRDDAKGEASQGDWQNRCVYRLNRSYIKPVKLYRGWELYDIPFETGDKDYVQLYFEADKAPMAVIHADPVEAYGDLDEEADEFAAKRPQRHNIIFSDGWPSNAWYSTSRLQREKENSDFGHPPFPQFSFVSGKDYGRDRSQFSSSLAEEIADSIRDDLMDEIRDDLMDEIRDDLGRKLADNLREEIMNEIRDNLVEEICDAVRKEIQIET